MSAYPKLILEIISGPLDGALITLDADTVWGKAGTGPLTFPWDDELGETQARFIVDEAGWQVESMKSPHGTYLVNKGERINEKVQLTHGDLLKASQTWLFVQKTE